MFDQWWPTVHDVGPTLVKHWVDLSRLLGIDITFIRAIRAVHENLNIMVKKTYFLCRYIFT